MISTSLAIVCLFFSVQQGTGLDDQILEKGDKLLEEAKAAYEDARTKASAPTFVEAGFKLEEARIKFIVLQEIGSPEKQMIATDRMRAINQLGKLIHDGKVAIAGTPAEPGVSPRPAEAPASSDNSIQPKTDPEPARPVVDVSKRAAVPDTAKQREAERQIKDLFKEQYAKKSPTDRQALAKALLDQAAKTADDPPALWVLYREAQDISAQLGDVRGTIKAADSVASQFDVDALATKQTALSAVGKTVKTPAESGDLSIALLDLTDLLIAADQYEAADKTTALALQAARKSGDVGLVTRATTRSKVVAEAKARFLAMKSVLQTLAKTPEDPGANNEMGQFLCFVKGSWDLGLRFLSKGSDGALKVLADKELAIPEKGSEQLSVADGWWDLADKEKSPLRKSQMVFHAVALYELAFPSTTGIVRAKVEKRLGEVDHSSSQGAGAGINLLTLIDLKEDTNFGVWKVEGKTLISPADAHARIQIPYIPPDEYDLTIEIVRTQKEGAAILGLAGEGHQFIVICDGWEANDIGGLDQVDNKSAIVNETCFHRKLFEVGKPMTAVCSVRKDGVSITVGGVKVVNWKGGLNRLSLWGEWKMNRNDTLFLAVYGGVFKFNKVTIVEPATKGKRLR